MRRIPSNQLEFSHALESVDDQGSNMTHSRKVKRALRFTKLSVNLILCWPPAADASGMQQLIFNISWWFMFTSAICLLLPLGASIYVNRDNPETMTQSLCLLCAVGQCVIKSLFAKIRRSRIQKLIGEVEKFLNSSGGRDMQVLEKYVNQQSTMHVAVTIFVYFTAFSFLIVPFVTDRQFPSDAVYPFAVESTLVTILVYLHQSLVAFQVAAAVMVDCFTAMILWFLCARFEILASSMKGFSTTRDLKAMIRHHQKLIAYADEVQSTLSLFVLSTLSTSIGGMLFSTIQLVGDQSIMVKAQFAVVAVTAGIGLFLCSLAAETLHAMGYAVGDEAFQSDWITKDKEARLYLIHIIRRSQKPICIRANKILPALSLPFFSQFIMTSFKFFTSLRIMVSL